MSTKTLSKSEKNTAVELSAALKVLEESQGHKNYYEFYDFLKTTGIPFLPCTEKNTQRMHARCFDVLHQIGETSIPVAVALSMHYYILAAMASYPFPLTSKEHWKRELLLHKIRKENLLIANTGSVRTFKSAAGDQAILAKRSGDQYIINGKAPFMSLSGIADYAVFTAALSEAEKAVFFVPLDQRGIVFTSTSFGDNMEGSFTKSVAFHDLHVDSSNVIQFDASIDQKCELLIYQRSWFQGLIPAPYLGASKAVLEQLLLFAEKKERNGSLLITSESFQNEIGALQLKYKAGLQLTTAAATAMADFKIGIQSRLEQIFETSVIAKHFATHFSEEIVTKVRQLMGTAFLAPGSLTDKVYKEIVFGVLQPMTDLDIRQYFGRKSTGLSKS